MASDHSWESSNNSFTLTPEAQISKSEVTVAEDSIDLVESTYLHLTEKRYPNGCKATRKRSIRKKASKFVVQNGKMFFKKKKKGKGLISKLASFMVLQLICRLIVGYSLALHPGQK